MLPAMASAAKLRSNSLKVTTAASEDDDLLVKPENGAAVCVTGATGYIGSWLVQSLLKKGYVVHATARDLGKAACIFYSLDTCDHLKVFQADLDKEGSFDEAVKGCVGVFHVAASMMINPLPEESLDDYVHSNILQPAIRGTTNLLQSCCKVGSVKRVVFTSSISTITGKDEKGQQKLVIDETSLISAGDVWKRKPAGWVYILLKLMTEQKAFEFAREKGINLVSIIPPTVAGAFLTRTVPSSVRVLLSPITGDSIYYNVLKSVHSRLGSFPLVHIEDICDSHIFLMEHAEAEGKYICATGSCSAVQLFEYLSKEYPPFDSTRFTEDMNDADPKYPQISSKKLIDLGFEFKHDISNIVNETIEKCIQCSFLQPLQPN